MTEKRATDRPGTLAIDPLTGGLRMGATAHPVADPTDPEQVYGAYLSLLYAVRGARRGEEIPLRSTDLDALLAILGEDVELIERRLIELMGCTAEEATLLRRVLVRHRNLAASVGAVAGLSLVALLGPSVASATPASTPSPASSPAVVSPADPTELPPLSTYLTTDDGRHVPVPDSWTSAPAAEPSQEPAVTAASVSPSAAVSPAAPAPSVVPSVAPPAAPVSPQAAPTAAAPVDEVVLGAPRTPIDRPGWTPEPAPETSPDPGLTSEHLRSTLPGRPGPEDEVALGEARPPLDRPGWSPEQEVEPVDPNEGTPRAGWTPDYAVEPQDD